MGWCSVYVIGPDVEGQLAPYENAIERGYPYASSLYVDVLDYMKGVFLAGVSCTRAVDVTGKIYPPWDEVWNEVFSTHGTLAGGPPPLPQGLRRKDFPAKDVMSFAAWAKYFYTLNTRTLASFKFVSDTQELGDLILRGPGRHDGWIRIEGGERVVEWVRIPRAYWFYWNVGHDDGSGAFMLKKGVTGELKYRTGRELPGTSYSAKKGEIDFAAMREEAMRGAAIAWNAHMAREVASGRGLNTTDQDVYKALEAANVRDAYRFNAPPRQGTREEYIESWGSSEAKLNIWQYVFESRWYEPVFMPWHKKNENDLINSAEWLKRTNAFWNGLPEDTLITLVTCKV